MNEQILKEKWKEFSDEGIDRSTVNKTKQHKERYMQNTTTQQKVASQKPAAAAAARDVATSLTDIAADIAQEGYEMVADKARLVADTAEEAYDAGVGYVKRNPGKALLGSAVIGFLAATWLRRKN